MVAWWSSLESVNRFAFGMQICAVVFVILSGVCQYASIRAGQRASKLASAKDKAWQNRIDEAERRAESADRQAKRLSVEAEPRQLADPMVATRKLKQLSGQKLILWITEQPEAHRFGMEVQDVLKSAGWQLDERFLVGASPPPIGMIIKVPEPRNLSPAAKALIDAFGEAAGQVRVEVGQNFELIIGSKPIR